MTKSRSIALLVLVGAFLTTAPGIALAAEDRPAIDSAWPPQMADDSSAQPPPIVPVGLTEPWVHDDNDRLVIPAPDVAALLAEDEDRPEPLRIGVVLETDVRTTDHGRWNRLDDGDWLWTMTIATPGAKAIRVGLSARKPPRGATLLLYDPEVPEKVVSASLTAAARAGRRGTDYLTHTLPGGVVRLEYRIPSEAASQPGEEELHLSGVAYIYRGISDRDSSAITELGCHLDAACYPAWNSEMYSVGRMTYTEGANLVRCSGAMLGRVPGDYTPVFMTAEHCDVGPANIDTVEIMWKYHKNGCPGSLPDPFTLPKSDAQISLTSDFTTDFRLLGLAFDEPSDTLFAGWDSAYWAHSSPSTAIHHPKGTYKRISFGTKEADNVSPLGRHAWKIRYDQGDGLSEQGSSGSPIFDSSHRMRGVDSYAYESLPASCNRYNEEYYGRFDEAWSKLGPFLDPPDPVFVDGSHTGQETGTITYPFNRALEGAYAVPEGSHLYIKAGTYDEAFIMEKGMIVHAQDGTVVIGTGSSGP